MLTSTARLVLFVSSYAPLLLLFALLDSFGAGWPSVVCAVVAVVSVLLLLGVWSVLGRAAGDWLALKSSKSRDADVMAFLVPYVAPFAAAQDEKIRTRWAMALFAVVVAALYLRSAIFYVHPLLLLAGYHVFEGMTRSDVPVIVLTRNRYLRQQETLWAVRIASGVYVSKEPP